MNFSNLLGAVVQAGMSQATQGRLRNVLGAGENQETETSGGGGLGGALSGLLGGGSGQGGGGLDALSGLLGSAGGEGGIGGMLQGVLGQAGQAVGGGNKLALGGLGALAGSLLGGSGSRMKGAVGGGVMAMLGAMAFKALKQSGAAQAASSEIPVGLREPENDEQAAELEQGAELMLRAMINAAKSDGEIDRDEVQRILGKLEEAGLDEEVRNWVIAEMNQPLDTTPLVEAAQGNPQLAAQLYAASMLAIEVDTPAEQAYLKQLAGDMELTPETTAQLEQMVGLQA